MILSISCACAGKHVDDRIPFWRQNYNSNWLPENIEIDIDIDGNVITRQLQSGDGLEATWKEFQGYKLPKHVSDSIRYQKNAHQQRIVVRYKLDCALSYLNQDASETGQHVVHARVPRKYRQQILQAQLEEVKSCKSRDRRMTLLRKLTDSDLENKQRYIENQIEALALENEDEWILFNGPNVTSTSLDDALSYHQSFKEPCILVYRQLSEEDLGSEPEFNITRSDYENSSFGVLSGASTVALDCEFVQIEQEQSFLSYSGSKVFIREARNAVGRLSIIDCDHGGKVMFDYHVLPLEPIQDYLTRFSGIVPDDLNPKTSRHQLISATDAYLLLRSMVDKGSTFVGHGLQSDFLTLNLFVPLYQIIDTVDLFHLENRRSISLRFLTKVLLKMDIQQDIHDSIEDALAAFKLLEKAKQLMNDDIFDRTLNDVYEIGSTNNWQLT